MMTKLGRSHRRFLSRGFLQIMKCYSKNSIAKTTFILIHIGNARFINIEINVYIFIVWTLFDSTVNEICLNPKWL